MARLALQFLWAAAALCLLSLSGSAIAGDSKARQAEQNSAARGYQLLTQKAYLPADFDQEVFEELWKSWEEPLRSQAEKASVDERRKLAFSRYGLTQLPSAPPGTPTQYVVDGKGNWSMNCLACHQGKVAGRAIPGVPNSLFALETLTEDVRATKLRMGKELTRMDLGSLLMPLGTTNGSTNAVMFGVVLLSFRDHELNVLKNKSVPPMLHHDHDAPAWWNFRKKQTLYSDGFADKNHRALMQFLLVKENGPSKFRQWENEFRYIYAYLESLSPPEYPWEIDKPLAETGRMVFEQSCARCHGTYGEQEHYPNDIVPIEEVGTDRTRLDALTVEHRLHYSGTWFDFYGRSKTTTDPGGYVAPPLDGIWASAPYFHNGSVPTLWHVLNPAERPRIWLRTEDGYDQQRVGLEVTTFEALPPAAKKLPSERRRYFDTTRSGKSAAGHDFPNELTVKEKTALLEYLKTL